MIHTFCDQHAASVKCVFNSLARNKKNINLHDETTGTVFSAALYFQTGSVGLHLLCIVFFNPVEHHTVKMVEQPCKSLSMVVMFFVALSYTVF